MSENLEVNKWVILDRLQTLQAIAQRHCDAAYDDVDQLAFSRIRSAISEEIDRVAVALRRRRRTG